MRPMLVRGLIPLALLGVLAGCAGSATTSATGALPSVAPSESIAAAATTAASTAAAATAASAPASASPVAFALGPGEPWLLHDRYLPNRRKGVFLVRPDGSDDHQILTDIRADLRAPTWTPDGSRIAFVYWGAGGAADGEIWTATPDGSDAAKLFDGSPTCSGAFYPAYSPDGKTIAFVCYTKDGNGRLATYDPATRVVTTLYQYVSPEHLDNPPRWSPDGTTIAFDVLHWDPTNQFIDGSRLAVVPAAGGKVRFLTDFESFAAYPDWRPDGKRLLFNTYDQGNMVDSDQPSNLYEIDPTGNERRQVTTASTDGSYRITQARWDPSGERIWATIWQPAQGISFGSVDPTTGVVTDLGIPGSRPQPRPTP